MKSFDWITYRPVSQGSHVWSLASPFGLMRVELVALSPSSSHATGTKPSSFCTHLNLCQVILVSLAFEDVSPYNLSCWWEINANTHPLMQASSQGSDQPMPMCRLARAFTGPYSKYECILPLVSNSTTPHPGTKLEGDLGEIVALGAEISP